MKVAAFLTARCPHKCKFCGVYNELAEYPEASLEEWIEAIEAVKPTFFIFFGGEPQLYPHWEELAKYLKKESINYTVFTTTKLIDEPITVSIDSDATKRSKFGMQALANHNDVVVNTQMHADNIDFAIRFLRQLNKPWLVDLNHGGKRKDGKNYILRAPTMKQVIRNQDDLDRIFEFLANRDNRYSLESKEVYEELLDHYPNGWRCKPEEHVGYLTLAPDTSLMACVDLPLIHHSVPLKKLWAKDWPNNKEEYIRARAFTRDQYCYGCCWRHEISALMNRDMDWSTEGMLRSKK